MYLVLDGNPCIYRGTLKDPERSLAGIDFLFTTLLDAIRQNRKVDRIVILFDPAGAYWRHAVYPEYKEHRKTDATVDLRRKVKEQIELCKEIFQHLPVYVLCCEGYEADDAAEWLNRHLEDGILFYTIDRDWLQLVDEAPTRRVHLFDLEETITKAYFTDFDCPGKPRGWSIQRFILRKCILGDTSDNIKGVTGIGPVRLMKYLPLNKRNGMRMIAENRGIIDRNIALMALDQVVFMDYANETYSSQLIEAGVFSLKKLKPLMRDGLWSHSADFDIFRRFEE